MLDNVFAQSFFARHTPLVAKELVGANLCRRFPNGDVISGRIIETEAYRDNEAACHAARGKTPRCEVMFGPPGIAYVYFIYGNYHCLNVVTEPEGSGCAILIRAVESFDTNGPGKLCREWDITRQHNGINLLSPESEIWLSPGASVPRTKVGSSSRIGISAAQELQWRFFLKDHPGTSGPKSYNRTHTLAKQR